MNILRKAACLLCAFALLSTGVTALAEDYTAEADGMGGKVPVTVSYADGKITAVTVGENKETVGIGDKAIEAIPARIVEEQSLVVDAVAGRNHHQQRHYAGSRSGFDRRRCGCERL